MFTLGIETSCDETSIGIIKDNRVLANIVSSQIAHTRFGGVVPELAARNHIKILLPLMNLALESAKVGLNKIELISATRGPGLLGSLLTGLSFAKSLAIGLSKPFIGVNHLEGHIYGLFFNKEIPEYPYLVLIVSGGHTELIFVETEFKYRTLGRTLDDACGEAFDKVAKMLGLPYPGGPYIEKMAKEGDAKKIRFPVPRPGRFNFSYAGLKTAVLYYLKDHRDYNINDVAASFQESALEHLIQVSKKAIEYTGVENFGVVGGVSVNNRLKEKFQKLAHAMGFKLFIPEAQFCTDNGAMIALAGLRRYKRFGPSDISVDAVAREPLELISKN
ncbi:MAG: tRNA (adenosine(37)-N6)-threonylcarbamoyltransferase complex transferase subunit TsaD [candidate division WOR-3 bacterium]|nr:tRNA (adenosine(37)-N6)-threonylcarbamoyltransferase complex transferase subunit TsaD [candidate division WOR-3 bacterium]